MNYLNYFLIITDNNDSKTIYEKHNEEKNIISNWLEMTIKNLLNNKTYISETIRQGLCDHLTKIKILKIITDDSNQIYASCSDYKKISWRMSDKFLVLIWFSSELFHFWFRFGSLDRFYSLLKEVSIEKLNSLKT